jgi:hypothetical protein
MQIPPSLRNRLSTLLWGGIAGAVAWSFSALSSWLAKPISEALKVVPASVWLSLLLLTLVFSAILACIIADLHRKIKLAETKVEKGLEFDPQIGVYRDPATKVHYCPKCVAEGRKSPMQTSNPRSLCICNACGIRITGPDYQVAFLV